MGVWIMATLSVMALYNYDNTLLDGLIDNLPKALDVPVDQYPDSYITPSDLNVNALIDNIMIECAELEFMYPSLSLAKRAINSWAAGMSHKWQKLYNTLWLAYNPLWNNWRRLKSQRDTTDAGNNTETRNITGSRDVSRDITNTRTDDTTETTEYTSTNTRTDDLTQASNTDVSVAAYNSSDYDPREQTVTDVTNTGTVKTDESGSGSVSDSGTVKNDGTETVTETTNDGGTIKRDSNNTGSDIYSEQTEGSIGTITSEVMLKQERDAALFNIYDIITTDFKNRFCLLIY